MENEHGSRHTQKKNFRKIHQALVGLKMLTINQEEIKNFSFDRMSERD